LNGIERRHRPLVTEQTREAAHRPEPQLIEILGDPCRAVLPARQGLAVVVDALAGQNLRRAIERRQKGRHPFEGVYVRAEDAFEVWTSGRCGKSHVELAGVCRAFRHARAVSSEQFPN
jgi:hypothetical protein